MLGVVIWSAVAESKAIIWYEDHGELAFLGQCPHSAASRERFNEGDLIQFDLTEFDNLRFAQNPRRIAQQYCSDLGSVITKAEKVKSGIEAGHDAPACGTGELVDFEHAKRKLSPRAGMAAR